MIVAAGAGLALAQGTPPPRFLSDEQVLRILNLALDNIGRARCGSMQPCAAATTAEKANPPVTIAEARLVIQRGVLSGAAEHCGLDWQNRNFLPMKAHWRQTMKKNERQMALIGLMHGITQGMAAPKTKASCTDQMRANLNSRLSFQP